jgi:hypothetical protein
MQRTSTLDDGLSVSAAPHTGALAVKEVPAHFESVADLCVTEGVRIHIDRTFTLEELPAALLASVRDAHSAKLLSAPPNAIRTRPDRGDFPEIRSSARQRGSRQMRKLLCRLRPGRLRRGQLGDPDPTFGLRRLSTPHSGCM